MHHAIMFTDQFYVLISLPLLDKCVVDQYRILSCIQSIRHCTSKPIFYNNNHHHHQNASVAEAHSADLVRRECPHHSKVPFLADGNCGAITNLVQPSLPWTSRWSSPAGRRAYFGTLAVLQTPP